jgi:LPXTG-site transpeptidase (sortase) family protein
VRFPRARTSAVGIAVAALTVGACESGADSPFATSRGVQTSIPAEYGSASASVRDSETYSPVQPDATAGSSHSTGTPAHRDPKRSSRTSSATPFELKVDTTDDGTISAPIAPLPAVMHSDGTAEPVDPPHDTDQQWRTVAWITQSAFPSAPSTGTSFIYGHACHYHICAFTTLNDAGVGNGITVRTANNVLSYRICATGVSPKSSNLVVPHCANGPADLVLVTCEYEQGDTSTNNFVVAATLTGAKW